MEYQKPALEQFDEDAAFGAACNSGGADSCASGGDADGDCTSGTGAHANCDPTGNQAGCTAGAIP